MIYKVFKILALVSLLLHFVLHIASVTGYFNRIFIAISLLVLVMPSKWWGLYILPVILLLAGLISGGYLLYSGIIAGSIA